MNVAPGLPHSRVMRHEGTIARWNIDRGFGFIKPKGGGPDVFFHVKDFHADDDRPRQGMTVTFDAELSAEGKLRATRVVVVGEKWSHTPAVRQGGARAVGYLAIAAFVPIMFLVVGFWGMPTWVFAVYGGASIVAFALYWQDKKAAIASTWRVPEGQLHLLGLVGGWPGSIVAQNIFRHKTRKEKFARNFWLTVLLNVLFFVAAGTIIHFDWLAQLLQGM